MKASKRSMERKRQERIRQKAKRRKAAEAKVFDWLEKRWEHELPTGKIPAEHKKKIRKDGAFQQLVAKVLRGEALVAPDLDRTPTIVTRHDGTEVDLMMDELGDDPNRYLCSECREPLDRRHDGEEPPVCQKCRDFNALGVRG